MQECLENLFIFVGITFCAVKFLMLFVHNEQIDPNEGEFGRFLTEKSPFLKGLENDI